MFTISKRFEFSASHVLDGLPDDHPCSRLHGHNYAVEVELSCDDDMLAPIGFVFDYRSLEPVKRWLDDTLDHRHLNEVVHFNPTAEHLATWLFGRVCDLLDLPDRTTALDTLGQLAVHVSAVRVFETPKTCAEYRK